MAMRRGTPAAGRRSVLRGVAMIAALLTFGSPAAARDGGVLVFAAASLKEALDEVGALWRQETGRTATVSYAASSALARQIEAGAPADLFVSADADWMGYLAERSLVREGTRTDLLGNSLVLVAPAGSDADLAIAPGFPLAEALGPDGRLAMANTSAVPAGKYGKAALDSLGVWQSVEDRVAQAENVRAALALVARGEAPFGIVYGTDAAAEPAVEIVGTFPADSHPPIVYPAAVLADAGSPDAAAFLAFLTSPAARRIFEKRGFTVLAGRG